MWTRIVIIAEPALLCQLGEIRRRDVLIDNGHTLGVILDLIFALNVAHLHSAYAPPILFLLSSPTIVSGSKHERHLFERGTFTQFLHSASELLFVSRTILQHHIFQMGQMTETTNTLQIPKGFKPLNSERIQSVTIHFDIQSECSQISERHSTRCCGDRVGVIYWSKGSPPGNHRVPHKTRNCS